MLVYTRDVPRGDEAAITAELDHIVAHLSAVASSDDDPETNADDVVLMINDHPDNPDLVRLTGTLDAEPDAPYLKDDYDPYGEVVGHGAH